MYELIIARFLFCIETEVGERYTRLESLESQSRSQ